jgi:excinuclease ABC subunit C
MQYNILAGLPGYGRGVIIEDENYRKEMLAPIILGHEPDILVLNEFYDTWALILPQLLEQQYGKRPHLRVPQRGDNMRLVELANKNALEEAQRLTGKEEKYTGSLALLGKMLGMEPPVRMEAYDISNISGTDIVAGMVVFENGRPKKSDYKKFKLEGLADQDDYGSMRQVLLRRFTRYCNGDSGFEEKPDLLLIDGGVNHANVALEVLQSLELSIPVFGMVKDDRHRTRALVTPEGDLIAIDSQQAVFALIGTVQEEVHRFAISYHRDLRSKRLRYSQLDQIPGVGPKRKELLLKSFHSIGAIRQATLPELERLLPKDTAYAVYDHFHSQDNQEEESCE